MRAYRGSIAGLLALALTGCAAAPDLADLVTEDDEPLAEIPPQVLLSPAGLE